MARQLRAVAELAPHEVHVGALDSHHVGLTLMVRRGRTVLVGPLISLPAPSMTKPLLVLQIGEFRVAMHPTAAVAVVPNGCKATINVTPRPEPTAATPTPAGGFIPSGGFVGDAINGTRTCAQLPGRFRNRRKCFCGCGGKQSHGGYADGIAMTGGCEWAMRYWVTHGQLPDH
ncbi:hypothetical protein [Mycolicibacterium llatzerense]|uniref:hypothetical protein n=1 Tax=Mycolicibacterium llatzerense TaxID=280871 RepID=UPI0021B6405D|nr:hypothetical protein [Mycolicibacterium llatzerense]MCT7372675.1 hypothetical protein [Mycolicibacterium llatzerense]